ncbi:MAG: ABC transporter permease [Planctomycetota bacterium]
MNGLIGIAIRELRAYYRLPIGWVVTALYTFLTGVVFTLRTLEPGAPATMQFFFAIAASLLAVVAPALSMRLFAEESRSGTLETLMTSPVGDASIVLGKFLGAAGCLVTLLIPTGAFVALLFRLSSPAPDPGPIIAGYLGLLLVGSLYLAVGLVASALTSSQTLAFLGAFLFLVGHLLLTEEGAARLPSPYADWAAATSITARTRDFAAGVIDVAHVGFFVAWTGCLLVVACVIQQARRWR